MTKIKILDMSRDDRNKNKISFNIYLPSGVYPSFPPLRNVNNYENPPPQLKNIKLKIINPPSSP